MPVPDPCPRCGGARAAGVCPGRLIGQVIDGPGAGPSPAIDLGGTRLVPGASHAAGVPESLALTAGPMPRVLLRDSGNFSGPGPVVRPGSDAMPGPGERAGRLQIHGEIARGGMGAVLKGRDVVLGGDLAIKVLLERHADDPGLIRRFVEEAQIAGQLQHPGVGPIDDLGTFADRRPYFAMTLIQGQTLAEVLDERAGLAEDHPRWLSIFLSIARTVAYAHARGVIHRDLKPSNVMVGPFGEVQVRDWGLAKVLPRGGAMDDRDAGKEEVHETVIATARSRSGSDLGLGLSQAGSVLGTPASLAPEQARGKNDQLDERADVFALGSIRCEMLTGRPAFAGRTSGEILRKAARGDVAEAVERLDGSGVAAELIALACDAITAEAADRPRAVGVVVDRLQEHLTGVQNRLRAAELARATAAARAVEEAKRRRLTVALAAALLAQAALGGGDWAAIAARRSHREALTARAVNAPLAEAAELRGRARATPDDQVAPLELALAVAQRGSSLLADGEGGFRPPVARRGDGRGPDQGAGRGEGPLGRLPAEQAPPHHIRELHQGRGHAADRRGICRCLPRPWHPPRIAQPERGGVQDRRKIDRVDTHQFDRSVDLLSDRIVHERARDTPVDMPRLLAVANAACSAALAGGGRGKDAPPEEATRAQLRSQSLTWLRADLSAQTRDPQAPPKAGQETLKQFLNHRRADEDFAEVRGAAARAGLPEAERKGRQDLCAEVNALIDKPDTSKS